MDIDIYHINRTFLCLIVVVERLHIGCRPVGILREIASRVANLLAILVYVIVRHIVILLRLIPDQRDRSVVIGQRRYPDLHDIAASLRAVEALFFAVEVKKNRFFLLCIASAG